MDLSYFTQKILSWVPSVDLGMEAKTFFLLVALLLFLISLLVNLFQRRYAKARFDRMLIKEDSVASSLEGINKHLNDLEWTCSVEMHGASSPQEVGKVVGAIRNKVVKRGHPLKGTMSREKTLPIGIFNIFLFILCLCKRQTGYHYFYA